MRAFFAALTVVVLACASPEPRSAGRVAVDDRVPPGWTRDPATADVVHDSSGFRFAAVRNGCVRSTPHDFDETGDNVSVGYNCSASGVWLTVYVYPRSFGDTPEPSEHFKLVVSDALSANPGAEVRRAAHLTLPLGAREVSGFNAYLQWIAQDDEVGSFVVLVPDGSRFVKVRTSFPLGSTNPPLKEAWSLTLAVLRSVSPSP